MHPDDLIGYMALDMLKAEEETKKQTVIQEKQKEQTLNQKIHQARIELYNRNQSKLHPSQRVRRTW